MRQRAHHGHRPLGPRCNFITSHGAHAEIPVPLHLVEACSALSAVVKMSLAADLVAHVAVIGQALQGLCVDLRNWLPVHSPPLLSSFPARLQLWAPLPRHGPACQVRSCWPALPASGSCSGTRVPEQEEGIRNSTCRPLVLFVPCFSRDVLLCIKLLRTRGLMLQANPFQSVSRALLWGFWSGKGQRR